MPDIIYTGARQPRAQVTTITVTASVNGAVYTITVGGKNVTARGTGTVLSESAATIVAAIQATTLGEFRECDWTVLGVVITMTGPSDGAPLDVTASATGGGSVSVASVVSAESPSDAGDVANYATGALPVAGDRLLFTPDFPFASANYRLNTFAAVNLGIVRQAGHLGTIGLRDLAPTGYTQYRLTHFQTAGSVVELACNAGDGPQAIRLHVTGANPSVTAYGESETSLEAGTETIEVIGTGANCTIRANGVGVAVAPRTSQVGQAATVAIANGSFRAGASSTLGAIDLNNANALISRTFANLRANGNSIVTVHGNAAATNIMIDAGVVEWRSTGSAGTVTVGSDGTFRTSRAPGAVAVTKIMLSDEATLDDATGRLTRPYDLELVRTEIENVTLQLGNNTRLTVAAL